MAINAKFYLKISKMMPTRPKNTVTWGVNTITFSAGDEL